VYVQAEFVRSFNYLLKIESQILRTSLQTDHPSYFFLKKLFLETIKVTFF
jgi:hypothetical protein